MIVGRNNIVLFSNPPTPPAETFIPVHCSVSHSELDWELFRLTLCSLTYREHWMCSLPLTVGMCHFNWMQSVPAALFKAVLRLSFVDWCFPSLEDRFEQCSWVWLWLDSGKFIITGCVCVCVPAFLWFVNTEIIRFFILKCQHVTLQKTTIRSWY